MSGTTKHLPTELLICWDEISHAIMKLLNTHNTHNEKHPTDRFNSPKLEIVEFVRNEEAIISYPDDIEDNMPDMLAGSIYNKNVLYAYDESKEEDRKYYI